ncbi:hypothetical protein [Colwellia sp. MEBiC06753]
MKLINQKIEPYRHYLIILGAILLAKFAVVPLADYQQEQVEQLNLLTIQNEKLDALINNQDDFLAQHQALGKQLAKAKGYVYVTPDEAGLKLAVQAKLDKLIVAAGCSVERIGFEGSTTLSSKLARWGINISTKGDGACIVNLTRAIEEARPLLKINSYRLNHRNLNQNSEGRGEFNARFQLFVWQMIDSNSIKAQHD